MNWWTKCGIFIQWDVILLLKKNSKHINASYNVVNLKDILSERSQAQKSTYHWISRTWNSKTSTLIHDVGIRILITIELMTWIGNKNGFWNSGMYHFWIWVLVTQTYSLYENQTIYTWFVCLFLPDLDLPGRISGFPFPSTWRAQFLEYVPRSVGNAGSPGRTCVRCTVKISDLWDSTWAGRPVSCRPTGPVGNQERSFFV